MSAAKKDSFLFENEDSDQQILPFDFMDEEEEEEESSPITNNAPIQEKQEENVTEISDLKEDAADHTTEVRLYDNTANEATKETAQVESEQEEESIPSTEPLAETSEETEISINAEMAITDETESINTEDAEEKIENSTESDTSEEAEMEVEAEEKVEETVVTDNQEEESLEDTPETIKMSAEDLAKSFVKPQEKEQAPPVIPAQNAKPGQILQEARVRQDLSLDQVSQNTKIKKKFIEALEQGDVANLPAPVYVEAYVKTLATLYKIDARQILSGLIKQKPGKVVPGELLSHIEEGKQINFEEEAKVNKFFKVAAILILIIALGIFLIVKFSGKPEAAVSNETTAVEGKTNATMPKISSEDLEVFIIPKPLTMTELTIPAKNNTEDENNI